MRFGVIFALLLSQSQPTSANLGSKPNGADSSSNPQTKAREAQPREVQPLPSSEDRLADYTLVLTVFTGFLAVGTLGLYWVARQQGMQIEREFAVAHRPKLRLRRIYFGKEVREPTISTPDGMGGTVETKTPPETAPAQRVIIELANVGGLGVAKANLKVTFTIFNTGQPVPWRIQEELERAASQPMEVSEGGSVVLVVVFNSPSNPFADRAVLSGGGQSVYCVGYVVYSDVTGKLTGRTGFIRRFDWGNRWFERVDFPDFEYAD